MSFREFLESGKIVHTSKSPEVIQEAKEPNLDEVEITNLPEELEDVSKSITQYFQAHFFLEFDTDPVLKARVSFLDKNGEIAANERPIADKDIDFTKAEILSFFTGEGEESEKVEFDEVSKFVKSVNEASEDRVLQALENRYGSESVQYDIIGYPEEDLLKKAWHQNDLRGSRENTFRNRFYEILDSGYIKPENLINIIWAAMNADDRKSFVKNFSNLRK